MPLSVTCPGCDAVYPVGEALIGKTIRCKGCGELIPVTAPAKAAPVAKAKPAARVVDEDDEDDAPHRKPARGRDDEDDAPRKVRRPVRAAAADDEDDEYDDAPRKGKKKGAPVVLIVGGAAAALLVAGGVGAYLAFGGKSAETAQSNAAGVNPAMTQPVAAGPQQAPPVTTPPKPAPPVKPAQPTTDVSRLTKDDAVDSTGTKPTPNTVPVSPSTTRAGPSSNGTNPRDYMLGIMDPITLDRAKRASVFFKVETDTSIATGSGWFGMEPGLIFTNAHVIGMKAPGSKEPRKITAYLNSGTDDQREIQHSRLKILAVDRDIDLALLQVIGERDLPVPLPVKPSADLVEGQGLKTFGFPFGYRTRAFSGQTKKEPEVSVRPTTYTAPRKNDYGQTRRIQIEGGVYTGNSGGPVVDAEGAVVGVSVEVQLDTLSGGQTQLGMAVPSEYVLGLLAGRIGEVEYQTPYRQAGKVHIPVKMTCLDPLNRLNKVGIAGWVGDSSGKFRKPGMSKSEPTPSDEAYQVKTFKIEKPNDKTTVASGELVLPELPPGRAYWVQPFYGNSNTPEYWLPGIRVTVNGPPVDRTPADLIVKFRTGTKRSVTMSNSSDLSEYVEGEGESKNERLTLKTTLKVTEQVFGGEKDFAARLRFVFEEIGLKAEIGAAVEQDAPKRLMKLLNDYAKLAEALGYMNRQGQLVKYQVNTMGIQDPSGKVLVTAFATDAMEAVQATSIPLPNRRVEAGEKWEAVKNVRLSLQFARVGKGGKPETHVREYKYVDKVTYTYVGQRERAGKKEAVIVVEGKVTQAQGAKETASGELKGLALVEIDTGTVVESEIESEFELDTSGEGTKKRVSGINKYKLSRGAAAQ